EGSYNKNDLESAHDGLAAHASQQRINGLTPSEGLADVLPAVVNYEHGREGHPREVAGANGQPVTVRGGPQYSQNDASPEHASTMAYHAAQAVLAPDTASVSMGRPINETVGGDVCTPNIRPDTVRVTTDGSLEMTEVRSQSQCGDTELDEQLETAAGQL